MMNSELIRMYELALVIDCQGGDQQMTNLTSLLDSIDHSDFPKRHLTLICGNNGWNASKEDNETRLSGIAMAIQLGCKYIVYADTDVVPPPYWWSKMKEVFDSDENVGIVYVNVKDRYERHNELVSDGDNIWEGFTGVRAQFWKDCGNWNNVQVPWKRVFASNLTVVHCPIKIPDRYTTIYYR